MRRLLPKVDCEFDPEIEAEFPANMSGKLTIEARGQRFEQKVVVPKGEPSNFLSEAELRAKFAGLADAVLGAGPCRRRWPSAVLAIDTTAGRRQPDAPGCAADAGAAGRRVGFQRPSTWPGRRAGAIRGGRAATAARSLPVVVTMLVLRLPADPEA